MQRLRESAWALQQAGLTGHYAFPECSTRRSVHYIVFQMIPDFQSVMVLTKNECLGSLFDGGTGKPLLLLISWESMTGHGEVVIESYLSDNVITSVRRELCCWVVEVINTFHWLHTVVWMRRMLWTEGRWSQLVSQLLTKKIRESFLSIWCSKISWFQEWNMFLEIHKID